MSRELLGAVILFILFGSKSKAHLVIIRSTCAGYVDAGLQVVAIIV